ncbi:hypothetical protein QFZ20_000478 [Flavobacterium sp. W4I14]|nr:hypothetical protein [Flavobacterium sp. W4I14]
MLLLPRAKKAINAIGFSETILKNFNLSNLKIEAATAGTIDFGQNWTFDRVNIKTTDQSALKVSNSVSVNP